MGGDEWEETRLVLLGELFGTNAWLTEGAEGAGMRMAQGTKNIHNCHCCSYSYCRDLDCVLLIHV